MKFVHLMHHVDMKGKRIEEAREMVEVRNTKYFHNGSFVGGGVLGVPWWASTGR